MESTRQRLVGWTIRKLSVLGNGQESRAEEMGGMARGQSGVREPKLEQRMKEGREAG